MPRTRTGWTLALVSVALFMVTLDNLVVTTALPSIRMELHAGLDTLEWTVNAYTLSFAVLLLTGAALGDRFGRRRMFIAGLSLFTLGSAAAALAPSATALIVARAVQGAGGAVVMPLTLTLLSEAFPAGRRGVALGVWSGISGLGVALGPVIGGAVVSGISWHWIFWLNVPVGIVVAPLAYARLSESFGSNRRFDIPGILLATAGLFGIVYGLVRANALGWGSATVMGALLGGAALLVAFALWERRSPAPMLPLRFFRNRAFSATNGVSYAMYFGMFGSIFLLAQFFQTAQHYSALGAGIRTLPWTAMPMVVAPIAGVLSDRVGSRPLMFAGLALQAIAITWIAALLGPATPYAVLIPPFMLAGAGMALVFAPSANAVLSAVRPHEAGQASGANSAIREVGGVFGVAVLATVFSHAGGFASAQQFVAGLQPAAFVGAGVLGVGALVALLVPGRRAHVAAEPEVTFGVAPLVDAA
ncbi:MAG: DHA2 family efflux MFS transporter permease subunit [Candidatus Dormibacteraeota bacterium]|nr:DHA2 family efflux MFS transporter permease subunit [Candidatus Dormibacteraeota bacterium]MBV9526572.1 DHA2 family efflux MFS transporter permease subunit [Candidatus Dormibacteraeota bacterium]